eukprot:617216-Amphidinium_carterae.1
MAQDSTAYSGVQFVPGVLNKSHACKVSLQQLLQCDASIALNWSKRRLFALGSLQSFPRPCRSPSGQGRVCRSSCCRAQHRTQPTCKRYLDPDLLRVYPAYRKLPS